MGADSWSQPYRTPSAPPKSSEDKLEYQLVKANRRDEERTMGRS